ncbi:glycosyltransferase family 4 protein [Priestia abyssalis]|uniref:glycosyltransferase family 4 protein n=1 Tax=Priestia abyssalis TaxID=1221450 RepID=UPI000995C8B3|nr:glycosyltransferase family 1 protein [Priestia abyssalis]
MKIAIDCRKLVGNKTGIGNYLESLLSKLLEIDSINKYYLLFDSLPQFKYESDQVEIICINKFREIFPSEQLYNVFWLNFLVPSRLKKLSIDIFWGPNFVKPIFFPNKNSIVTIHDLAFIKNKEDHSRFHSLYLNIYLQLTLKKNLKVLTVSEYTRSDVIKEFNLSEENVRVSYCAIETRNILPSNNLSLHLPKNYSLFVGTTEKRKNINVILESLAYSLQYGLETLPLVVVGAKGNGLEETKKKIKELGIEKHVYFTGYVTNEELAYIYSNAKIFIFPSLYEGFGIPLLEAMMYEVPIITSSVTSLPEVADDAALYIDPQSPQDLSRAVNRLLKNDSLQKELIQKGKQRLSYFSWEKSALVLLDLLREMESELK